MVESILRWHDPHFHVDPGDIDVDEPLGAVGMFQCDPTAVDHVTASEIRAMQKRQYEMIAASFSVPAVVDINRCSLEEWVARVDALVREVI
jgi:hypothetical protein